MTEAANDASQVSAFLSPEDVAILTGRRFKAQQQLGHGSVVMTETYVRARRGQVVKPTR